MIHVGDFYADGRKDLFCRKNKGERYQIALTGESISILFFLMVGFCSNLDVFTVSCIFQTEIDFW